MEVVMEEKQDFLGTAPLGKLMRKFAVPCTISLLVGALYNIVDQIFIGWGVGYLGNGATNVVFPLTVLALGLAVMIGDGACSYVSICFGRNQPENANRAVGRSIDRDGGHLLADLGDFHLGIRLAMALLTAIVLLGLVLVDDDLLAADLADDLALDLDALDNRRADLHVAVIAHEQNVKRNRGVNLSIDFLDVDHVALTDAVLFATSRNNRVHYGDTSS